MKKKIPKSTGEEFADSLFLIGVTCMITYLITQIFSAIFAPFRYLTMSNEQIENEEIEQAKKKIRDREERRFQYDDHPDNPLNQYVLRFRKYPERYRNDPENKKYERWYQAWSEGMVLDSYLYWAPEVYTRDNPIGRKYYNKDFLNYLDTQRKHHRKTVGARHVFLKTIRKYYPEFTANFSVLKEEIEELQEMTTNFNLQKELQKEISKMLPEKQAKKLSVSELPAEQILEKAKLFQAFHQQDVSETTCEICVRHYKDKDSVFWETDPNFGPQSEIVTLLNEIVFHLGKHGETVMLACLRKHITANDIREIIIDINEKKETFGPALYEIGPDGKRLFDEFIRVELDKRLKKGLKNVSA